jgi:hypothetical protein
MASEFVESMKTPRGKAAAIVTEAMPVLIGMLGPGGAREQLRIAFNGGCGCEFNLAAFDAKVEKCFQTTTQDEHFQLEHDFAHKFNVGVQGLLEVGESHTVIRDLFETQLAGIQDNVKSITMPEGTAPADSQKMAEAYFDLMDSDRFGPTNRFVTVGKA